MKKKTILVAAIAVMLVAALVVGGTLAYFTDTKSADNTFTVGNVKIDLLESSLHRENAGYVGTPGEELNPQNAELWSEVLKQGSNNTSPYKAGDTFYTDDQIEANAATYTCDGVELAPGQSYHKMPYVKNTGANDAYIRIRVMFPAELDTAVLNSSMYTTSAISRGEFTMVKTENVEKDGKQYNVYTFTRTEALKPNEMTYWNVWGTVHMDSDVTNEEIANLLPNGAFNVLVEADAIQADGFANATAAFAAFNILTPMGGRKRRPLRGLWLGLNPGAGGGAAAVRAQIEIMIPQKFPACALGRRESENSVLRNILSGRKVVCA